jgi:hypothetical protein
MAESTPIPPKLADAFFDAVRATLCAQQQQRILEAVDVR